MADTITLKAKGLFLNSNSLSAIPEGGTLEADNVVIDKDEIFEPRRGNKLYGQTMGVDDVNNVAQQLLNYEDRLIRHYLDFGVNGTLEYETASVSGDFQAYNILVWDFAESLEASGVTATYTSSTPHDIQIGDSVTIGGVTGVDAPVYNGTFVVTTVPSLTEFTFILPSIPAVSPAEGLPILQERTLNSVEAPENAQKIRGVEANGNFYLSTNKGVLKLDTVEGTITKSGPVKALDTELELIEDIGFLTTDSQVAYRVVWGYKDLNQNLILGAPSQRVIITNEILPSLGNDLNNLLIHIQAAAEAATGSDVLNNSPTGDYALYTDLEVADNASASQVYGSLEQLCFKLDADGVTGFNTIPATFPAPTASTTTTTELQSLVEFYDTIVNELLVSPQIPEYQQVIGDFQLHTAGYKVKVTFTVPENITTSYFYQIYRTQVFTSFNTNLLLGESDISGDEMQLVFEDNPTLEQLAAKTIEVIDITPDAFRGAFLYTNPNQETIVRANQNIPYANDLALYQNMLFYANTKTNHRLEFSFLSTNNLLSNPAGNASTLTFTQGSKTFQIGFRNAADGGEDVDNGIAFIAEDGSPAQNVDDTARSLVKTINRFSDNDFVYSYYLSGVDEPPGKILIETRDVSSNAFTIISNNQQTGEQFSPNLDVIRTSDNEIKQNRVYYSKYQQPEAVPLTFYFSVGKEKEPILRIVSLRDSIFVLKTDGVFKITGTDDSSLSLTAFDSSTNIQAAESAVVLDNQLYFFSDQGITRVSDTGIEVISRSIENVLVPLIAPSYTNFEKATFGIAYETDRKYILFTVQEKEDIWAQQAYVYNTFTKAWTRWPISKTCGIVNSRDDKLYLGASDTNQLEQERKDFAYTDFSDREFQIDIFTVTGDKNGLISAVATGENAVVSAPDHGLLNKDLIIITNCDAQPNINDIPLQIKYINQQSFSIPVSITGAGTVGEWRQGSSTYLSINSVDNIEVGDVVYQELYDVENDFTFSVESPVKSIDEDNLTLQLNRPLLFQAGTATIFKAINKKIRFAPQHAGNPFKLKQFSEAHARFDDFIGTEIQLSFNSNIQTNYELVMMPIDAINRWGMFPWNTQPWGGEQNPAGFRTYVPYGKQKSSFLGVIFEHKIAREDFEFEGIDLIVEGIGERESE